MTFTRHQDCGINFEQPAQAAAANGSGRATKHDHVVPLSRLMPLQQTAQAVLQYEQTAQAVLQYEHVAAQAAAANGSGRAARHETNHRRSSKLVDRKRVPWARDATVVTPHV